MFELFGAILTLAFLSDDSGSPAASRRALTTLLQFGERERGGRYTFYVVFPRRPGSYDYGWYALHQRAQWRSGLEHEYKSIEAEIDAYTGPDDTPELNRLYDRMGTLEDRMSEEATFKKANSSAQLAMVLDQARDELEIEDFSYFRHGKLHQGLGSSVRREPVVRWLRGWRPFDVDWEEYRLAGSISVYGDPDWAQMSDEELAGIFEDALSMAWLDHLNEESPFVVGVARPGATWKVDPSEFVPLESRELLGLPVSIITRWGYDSEEAELLGRLAKKREWFRIFEAAKGQWIPEDAPMPRGSEI